MTIQTSSPSSGFYERAFGSFSSKAVSEVRKETYGEDLGQNNWSSVDEFRKFSQWLKLSDRSHVLDVCSGSGGPALFLAKTNGCRVTGVDIHPDGLLTARQLAVDFELQSRCNFVDSDVRQPLPFPDGTFDALWCIDSVIHIWDRLALLREWYRLLKPGGRFLYTDPTLVTGMLSKEEIMLRGTPGYFLYSPVGLNERLIREAGLCLEMQEDLTQSVVELSERWRVAREKRKEQLTAMEGDGAFENMQNFLSTTQLISIERRLSRVVFVGYRP
ncbi:class I SAM-dependent methyltransferase [Xenorhabdus japonica]|uniref:Methyltransferase domain-containing protein n=1 Tax=Xenorhabdus japonica TaxID=53341 RepID=A0A1I5DMW9_9GAMM|nr:class I SAM-dependent methyltransferase [Xenorhabdus japonica]SFO00584.1 Methyltransferase domain-containing protein [Xenorhabdus japonica]